MEAHIENVTAQASRTLGVLRRNLHNCTLDLREATYYPSITPTVEYVFAVWDPSLATVINRLKEIQRRGIRFIHRNYWERTTGCVSRMFTELGRQSLEERRRIHRLTLLYQIQRGLIDISAGSIICSNDKLPNGHTASISPQQHSQCISSLSTLRHSRTRADCKPPSPTVRP